MEQSDHLVTRGELIHSCELITHTIMVFQENKQINVLLSEVASYTVYPDLPTRIQTLLSIHRNVNNSHIMFACEREGLGMRLV